MKQRIGMGRGEDLIVLKGGEFFDNIEIFFSRGLVSLHLGERKVIMNHGDKNFLLVYFGLVGEGKGCKRG